MASRHNSSGLSTCVVLLGRKGILKLVLYPGLVGGINLKPSQLRTIVSDPDWEWLWSKGCRWWLCGYTRLIFTVPKNRWSSDPHGGYRRVVGEWLINDGWLPHWSVCPCYCWPTSHLVSSVSCPLLTWFYTKISRVWDTNGFAVLRMRQCWWLQLSR